MAAHLIRAWLAKQLRRKAVPDAAWDFVVKYGYVNDAEQEEEGWQERLVEVARDYLRDRRDNATPSSGRRSGQEEKQTCVPLLTRQEQARAETLAGYLADHASGLRTVRQFRTTYLEGKTLSQEQALIFLASPATRFLARETFEQLTIPLIGHQATLLHEDKCGPISRTDWVGGKPVRSDPGLIYEHRVRLHIMWPEGSYEDEFTYAMSRAIGMGQPSYTPVSWVDAEGRECHVRAWPGTVLHHLGELSATLVKLYMWRPAAAPLFVLTGAIPALGAAEVSARIASRFITTLDDNAAWPLSVTRPRITITVEAWISDDTVMRAYKAAQQQVLKRDNHPLGERSLALVRFLTETDGYSLMTWEQRMAAWNQRYPLWAYEHVGAFYTAIKRAERQLCSPVQ